MGHYGRMLLAILVGLLIYFWSMPHLPYAMQHHDFDLDFGLLVALLSCVVVYVILDSFVRSDRRMD